MDWSNVTNIGDIIVPAGVIFTSTWIVAFTILWVRNELEQKRKARMKKERELIKMTIEEVLKEYETLKYKRKKGTITSAEADRMKEIKDILREILEEEA